VDSLVYYIIRRFVIYVEQFHWLVKDELCNQFLGLYIFVGYLVALSVSRLYSSSWSSSLINIMMNYKECIRKQSWHK
jgi:hypothetical protein